MEPVLTKKWSTNKNKQNNNFYIQLISPVAGHSKNKILEFLLESLWLEIPVYHNSEILNILIIAPTTGVMPICARSIDEVCLLKKRFK